MPRAANTSAGALRRNQACKQCRKRKLKCDAQRPHCGTCQKQWAAQISVPPPVGFAHPKEPNCTYDPVEGLVLAPETVPDPQDRVKLLEQQIIQLQAQLSAAQVESRSRSAESPPDLHHAKYESHSPPQQTSGGTGSTLFTNPHSHGHAYSSTSAFSANSNGLVGPSTSTSSSSATDNYYATGLASDVRNAYPSVSDEPEHSRAHGHAGHHHRSSTASSSHPYHRQQPHISSLAKAERDCFSGTGGIRPLGSQDADIFNVEYGVASVSRLGRQSESRAHGYSLSSNPSPPFFEIMYSGWSRDLPPRHDMVNYIEIFFKCDPCGSRMLHRPTLLNNLNYPPTHPNFPHPALLHAICATASRYTLRGKMASSLLNLDMSPPQANGPPMRDKFAEFHANKTRAYVNQTMSNGQNIFDVFQACIILSWWFYSEGRWVEVWVQAGFQTRAVIPLALNYLGLVKRGADGAPVRNPYLAPPKNSHDTETRRRAWWMAIMFDRIVSVGGWLHSVDERDIGTEFPLTMGNYEAGIEMPSHPQTLHSENLYIHHPLHYTDPYILFLKAVMLFGRVTDYTVRMGIRAPLMRHGQGGDDTSSFPHGLSPPNGGINFGAGLGGGVGGGIMGDPRDAPGFKALDQLVAVDFLNRFPLEFRSCLGVGVGAIGTSIDTDLYMAHLVPHAATITLHSPWVNYSDPDNCRSVARCMEASRAILDKYYLLRTTSFDITLLHPFVTICWYLAAVVQIHVCKGMIERKETAAEATIWGEINFLRDGLITYGHYSPIGARQEKMLHPIMGEIINMTTQAQPLLVGLPLYPFSLDSAFQRAERAEKKAAAEASGLLNLDGEQEDVDEAIAPIPDASYMEDVSMADAQVPGIVVPSLQGIGGAWQNTTG